MPIILILFSLFTLPDSKLLLKISTLFATPLQQFCLEKLSNTSHVALNSALLCGQSPTEFALRQIYIDSGLFHLLVVSGGHLTFICAVLAHLPGLKSRQTQIPILILFSLMTGWQPPVVRALFECFLKKSKNEDPFIPVMNSWLFCLACFPEWVSSTSLQLSILARLCFVLPTQNSWQLSLLLYFLLLPILGCWSSPQPAVAIIAGFLATPSFFIWFLVAVIEMIIPKGFFFTNWLIEAWDFLLKNLGTLTPNTQPSNTKNHLYLWTALFVVLVLAGVHSLKISRVRSSELR